MGTPYSYQDKNLAAKVGFANLVQGLRYANFRSSGVEGWIDDKEKIIYITAPLDEKARKDNNLRPFRGYKWKVIKKVSAPNINDVATAVNGLSVDFGTFGQQLLSLGNELAETRDAINDKPKSFFDSFGLPQVLTVAGVAVLVWYFFIRKG